MVPRLEVAVPVQGKPGQYPGFRVGGGAVGFCQAGPGSGHVRCGVGRCSGGSVATSIAGRAPPGTTSSVLAGEEYRSMCCRGCKKGRGRVSSLFVESTICNMSILLLVQVYTTVLLLVPVYTPYCYWYRYTSCSVIGTGIYHTVLVLVPPYRYTVVLHYCYQGVMKAAPYCQGVIKTVTTHCCGWSGVCSSQFVDQAWRP